MVKEAGHLATEGMDLAHRLQIARRVQRLGMGDGTTSDAFDKVGRQRAALQR
jgi:hypothetical protein